MARPILLLPLSLAVACAAAKPPPPAAPRESALTVQVEDALPRVAAAARRGMAREALGSLTGRPAELLSAWAMPVGQDAWNRFHELEGLEGPDAWAELGMARVYLGWKTLDQAALALGRAEKADPTIAELHVLRAELERRQADFAAAKKSDEAALALHPAYPFALDGLAADAKGSGDGAEAVRRWNEALQAWPDDYDAELGLADAAEASGDAKAALAALDRLHALAPDDMSLWLRSGRLRQKAGDLASAAKDYEAALQRGADDPELLRLLAKSYQGAGRTADERRVLTQLVAQAPDARSLSRLAELELAAGEREKALSDYEKAVAKDPKDVDAQLALARLWAAGSAYTQAIGAFRALALARPETRAELSALEAAVALSPKPLSGGLGRINAALGAQLDRLYRTLLAKQPKLGGTLRLRVQVNAQGHAFSDELVEDTVHEPALAANLTWDARDAHYPPTAASYVFKFELRP
ncbi:MAG: tetratricopeptide repeat protein [Deltaproteobacteria bacterium]